MTKINVFYSFLFLSALLFFFIWQCLCSFCCICSHCNFHTIDSSHISNLLIGKGNNIMQTTLVEWTCMYYLSDQCIEAYLLSGSIITSNCWSVHFTGRYMRESMFDIYLMCIEIYMYMYEDFEGLIIPLKLMQQNTFISFMYEDNNWYTHSMTN